MSDDLLSSAKHMLRERAKNDGNGPAVRRVAENVIPRRDQNDVSQ